MNVRDSDFDALLAEWLEDDPFVSPAAPVEAAVDFARSHPRRRDRLAFLRRDAMTSRATTGLRPVAIAVAVAALLVFAIGGAVLIGSGPDPSPTPMPSATAIPTATPVGAAPLPAGGALAPGQYTVRVPGGPITVSLTIGDDGWESGGWYLMNPPAFSRSVSFWTVGNVYEDLCDSASLAAPAIGPTVDDLVTALDMQASSRMSPAVDVVMGGYSGKRLTMSWPPSTACSGDPLPMWVDPNGEIGRSLEPGSRDTLWILDVDGERLVIVAYHVRADEVAASIVDDVIASMEFAVE
jgi:hypothetical protein